MKVKNNVFVVNKRSVWYTFKFPSYISTNFKDKTTLFVTGLNLALGDMKTERFMMCENTSYMCTDHSLA